jgi:PERQ amino acid-rich with GYF domain-containing protein
MATTTMHFGPEWMRKQPTPSSRPPPPPSDLQPVIPAPTINHANATIMPAAGTSTYSSLVTSTPIVPPEDRDVTHPFRYSKEEMIRIYKEGGGKGGLGLEVERWEGIVRDVSAEPAGLRDPGEAEKKVSTVPSPSFSLRSSIPHS